VIVGGPGDAYLSRLGPPIIGTLYVQQWALRKLRGGGLPDRDMTSISRES